jgi:transposase
MRAGVAGELSVRGASEDRPLDENGDRALSERRRRYRRFSGQQKLELVLVSLRGEKTIAELCREHEISETLLRRWRDQVLEAGAERLDGGQERSQAAEQRRRIAELERAGAGWQDLRAGAGGKAIRGLGGAPRGAVVRVG